ACQIAVTPLGRAVSSFVPTLHASMLIAPVPCVRTLRATVFSARGLRARTMGSNAGLRAVPQPSHASVAVDLPTLCDFGNPELPVTNTFPLRRATKAPVGTVRHQT